MKKINLLTIALFLISSIAFAQSAWNVDKSHSKVGFTVSHMVIVDVDGFFKEYSVDVKASDDFTDAKVSFEAEVNSIFTNNDKRDAHLKSADFFDAENHPKITFVGKSMKKVDEKNYILTGDFTMRGVTKEIELDVKYKGLINDPWGNTRAGFGISGEVNRFDYGLQWNKVLETGGLVVSEEVELDIDLELIKAK